MQLPSQQIAHQRTNPNNWHCSIYIMSKKYTLFLEANEDANNQFPIIFRLQ